MMSIPIRTSRLSIFFFLYAACCTLHIHSRHHRYPLLWGSPKLLELPNPLVLHSIQHVDIKKNSLREVIFPFHYVRVFFLVCALSGCPCNFKKDKLNQVLRGVCTTSRVPRRHFRFENVQSQMPQHFLRG